MPVRKFRSVEEMGDTWLETGPALWAAIAQVWDLGRRMAPVRYPPGVHRNRSIDDAERVSEAWERESFEAATRRKGEGDR